MMILCNCGPGVMGRTEVFCMSFLGGRVRKLINIFSSQHTPLFFSSRSKNHLTSLTRSFPFSLFHFHEKEKKYWLMSS